MTYTFTGNIKKYPAALLLLIFICATLFAPVMVMAGHEPIGTPCSSSIGGGHCRSGDCEDSSKDTPNDDFCDCDDDNDCELEYGQANPNVTNWECWDGAHATYDLDYCVGTIPGSKSIVKYPIEPRDPSFVDKLLDPQVTLDEIQKKISTPQPRITIPGLEFSKAQAVMDRGKTYMIFPFLGEYIAAIYRYAVVVASALAVLVIIVSGIQWMLPGNLLTSGEGDSKQTTNQAKKRIGGALVGLTIAVGSYTILYLVNPELVKFKNLRVLTINTIELGKYNEDVVNEPNANFEIKHGAGEIKGGGNSITIPTASGITYGHNDVPWFFQFSPPWAGIQYGSDAPECTYQDTQGNKSKVASPPGCCATIGKAGCGPAAFAMAINALGNPTINPSHIAKIANQTGARVCGKGTTVRTQGNKKHKFLTELETQYGVKITILTTYNEAIIKLRANKFMVVSGKSAGYGSTGKHKTYKGHYLVLTGAETIKIKEVETEIIHVNDSGNRPHKGITYMTTDQLQAREPLFYLIEKK